MFPVDFLSGDLPVVENGELPPTIIWLLHIITFIKLNIC